MIDGRRKLFLQLERSELVRYHLRYTQDLLIIRESENPEDLKVRCDYKIHIWDDKTGSVIWQNAESERYGNHGYRI